MLGSLTGPPDGAADERVNHGARDRRVRLGLRRIAASAGTLGALALAAVAIPAGAQADSCPNAEFRTGSSAHLPDCRAYEMVTAPDTNNGDTLAVGLNGVGGTVNASPTEGRVAYTVSQGFGDAEGFGAGAAYLANRSADGWLTHAIQAPSAPKSLLGYQGIIKALTLDLSKEVVLTNIDPSTLEPLPGGAAGKGPEALYLRNNDNATYRLVMSLPAVVPPAQQRRVEAAITPDGSAVFIEIRVLISGTFISSVHRFDVETGQLSNVAVLPDTSESVSARPAGGLTLALNAFSGNGSVFFFDDEASDAVFRRDLNAETTTAINASENTTQTVALGSADFGAATVDGTRAFFSSFQPLVDGDTNSGPDLYRYDATKPAGQRLTALTSNGTFRNFVSATDDGSRVYFADEGQLTPGVPVPPQYHRNLYLWDNTGATPTIKYIATLEQGDANGVAGTESRMSTDGRYLGFVGTTAGITADSTGGFAQVYLYDADASGQTAPEIACASCLAPPAAPTALARFQASLTLGPNWGAHKTRRNLADTGRLFFETATALVPEDTNQRLDVYQYVNGKVDLISSGRGSYDAYFGDSTKSGDDVYIYTGNRLVAAHNSDNIVVYDARVGGGFAGPSPATPCSGDQCRGPASAPPVPPVIGSISFSSDGNVMLEPAARRAAVRISRVKAVTGSVARLRVRVAGPGRIAVAGARVRRAAKSARRAGVYTLKVALKPRVRRALRKSARHRLRVRVRVSYRAKGGSSAAKTVRLTFKQPKAKRAMSRKGGR